MSAIDDYKVCEPVVFPLRRGCLRHTATVMSGVPDSQRSAAQFVTLCVIRDHLSCDLSEIVPETAIDEPPAGGVVAHLKGHNLGVLAHTPGIANDMVTALITDGNAVIERVTPSAPQIVDPSFGESTKRDQDTLVQPLRQMGTLHAHRAICWDSPVLSTLLS